MTGKAGRRILIYIALQDSQGPQPWYFLTWDRRKYQISYGGLKKWENTEDIFAVFNLYLYLLPMHKGGVANKNSAQGQGHPSHP
jgi:hypothetical protein